MPGYGKITGSKAQHAAGGHLKPQQFYNTNPGIRRS